MRINKIYFVLGALLMLLACSSADEEALAYDENLEIRGVQATIAPSSAITRSETGNTSTGIGRTAFVANDQIVFTKITRTNNSLPSFTYSDVSYLTSDGTKWNRTSTGPEKIYWSDASSAHTFIGYSLPQKEGYSFENKGASYQGKLSTTDYSTGNSALASEDLLLCYNTDTKAETGGVSAKVSFEHAMSCMRVVVNIQGYSANTVDTQVDVDQMKIESQPSEFTWNELGKAIEEVTGSTKNSLTLWRQSATGDGNKKTFTFLGLTVPHCGKVPFSFQVNYDPQNTTDIKEYKGEFNDVDLKSGLCTTLSITLNHQGEQIGTSVSYSDWSYVFTPDIGELRKKSTFMDMKIDNDAIKIHTSCSSEDDATWLYGSNENTKDIYGNDGSAAYPFVIKSAPQLLAFAKEVNQGNLDFDGKFIRLDADITMQKTNKDTTYVWPGIGTDSRSFNGTFLGGDRYINRLGGNSLFVSLGEKAVVEQLHITTVGTIDGGGALADSNAGIVGGCKVIDDVNTTGGALVGTNSGTIHACYYTGSNDVPLVGSGATVGCYVAKDITSFHEAETKVGELNLELDDWYNKDENKSKYKSQFKFVHSPGNYPTVKLIP